MRGGDLCREGLSEKVWRAGQAVRGNRGLGRGQVVARLRHSEAGRMQHQSCSIRCRAMCMAGKRGWAR